MNRKKRGVIVGVLGAVTNLILAIGKLVIGLLNGSMAVLSDSINNFGDVISSSAVWVSFMISGKKADKYHPFGHGRFEYVAGFLIAIVIIIVAIEFIISSVKRIITPEPVSFSWLFFGLISASIAVKIGMAVFYHFSNKGIKSITITAAKNDSVQDVFISSAALVSFSLSSLTDFPLDGVIAAVISLIILINGISLIKGTMDNILGKKPDKLLISKIMSTIMDQPMVLGAHDLLLHDYGHNNYMGSVHVELCSSLSLKEAHTIIDDIETKILKEHKVDLVIHLDPVDTFDDEIKILKRKLKKTLQEIDPALSFHDFRLDKENKEITIDLVIPFEMQKFKEKIKSQVQNGFGDKDYTLNFIVDYK